MFELKRGTANLQGTCYFEFVKNSDKKKTCWNEIVFYPLLQFCFSYYLEQELFSFFYPIFRKASDKFDWYAFNKLNQSEIKRLEKELLLLERELKGIKYEEQFKSFFEKIFFWIEADGNSENWKEYIEIFKTDSIKLRELAVQCLEEKQVLWVLGI